jgi:ABC-type transport system substrate-binding protein
MRDSGILICLCISILFFSSCKRPSQKISDEMIFCYNEPANITSLDPAFARSMANIWAVNQIFNGLVQLDNSLNIIPCIAKSWVISEDGRIYVFHLRDDVFFHKDISTGEGRKVIASDFVYSFQRILDPSTASPGTWIFQNVRRNNNNIPAFLAPDDTTFTIELNDVFPPFLGLLAMQYCSVVPRESVEYYGQDFRKHPVGTGPFKFQFWKENVRLVLLKNPDYFEQDSAGNHLPYLDAVNITFIVDRQTAFLDFLKGNIHMISGIDATYKDALLERNGQLKEKYINEIDLLTEPFLNTEYLGFHLGKQDEAFHDVRIRKALNSCFDRTKMIRYLRNNMGTPGIYGFVPPHMPGFSENIGYGYDYNPEYASKLLAEAGYPGGKGLPPFRLTTTSNYLDLCQFIQHEAAKIGIIVKIDVTPPATLREMITQGNVDFFRASWIADYPDAENYLSLFSKSNFPPAGPNYTRFHSEAFERLFRKAVATNDDMQRFQYYCELDSMVMEASPVIILYYDVVVRFIRKEVTGLSSNPMNLLTLKYTRIKPLK